MLTWRRFEVANASMPATRNLGFQTVTVVGADLFVLGSYPADGRSTLSMHVFNLSRREWRERNLRDKPRQRFGATTTLVDDMLYVFGGTYIGSLNDLHTFDLVVGEWQILTLKNPPPPLFTHTGHFAEHLRKILIVCGVIQGGRRYSEDVYALDPDKKEWYKCVAKGRSPACGFHGSCLSFDKIFVVGWSEIVVEGGTSRSNIGCSLVYFYGGGLLHLGGKRFSTGPTADIDFLHWYDLNEKTVSLVRYDSVHMDPACRGPGPTERRNFGMARVHDKILVFGGYQEKADPMYELDVSSLC